MAGGKQTPRQRMMGILYLVLLGLVALQIPDSLLDAFKNITESLTQSKTNVDNGITNTFTAFEQTKLKEQHERAEPFYEKAKAAREATDQFSNYVESLKQALISETGGTDPDTHDYKGRADMDISFRYMINGKKAIELRKKADETRQKLISLLDPADRDKTNITLQISDPQRNGIASKTWEDATFGEGIPLGASITALTKLQVDAKNTESEVVKKILGKVDQAVVNLDQFSAVAVAPTSYVLVGQPYTAEVFLTASDSKSTPEITVDGGRVPVEAGRGKYNGSTASEGIHTWTGTINIRQADGTFKQYKTMPQTYQVAKPSAVVSPDKMLVLYIGVPNPVSVSAPGVAKDKIKASISGGTLSGSDGHYTATVTTAGTATVTVSGTIGDGANAKTVTLGSTEFRVKRIPDPHPQFGGKGGGKSSAANLRAQDALFAKLDGFEFDAKFNITRFSLVIARPRADVVSYNATGSELTPEMKKAMAAISPGTIIVFQNIIAVGPDGTQRGLDDMSFTAN